MIKFLTNLALSLQLKNFVFLYEQSGISYVILISPRYISSTANTLMYAEIQYQPQLTVR